MNINDLYPSYTKRACNDRSIFSSETPVAIVAKQLKRGRQTIYNVYNFLKCGGTALEYFEQYKENKRRCGRTEIIFPAEEKEYIAKRSTEGWTPDVIIGRAERTFSCSVSTPLSPV